MSMSVHVEKKCNELLTKLTLVKNVNPTRLSECN